MTDAAQECGCNKSTAVDVYQWLREVCSTVLCNQQIILGGPGVVVQIDESQFTHKPKVICSHSIISSKTNIVHSIIEDVHQYKMFGCLDWLTRPVHQH